MDGKAYLEKMNARAEKMREIAAISSFLMAVGSIVLGVAIDAAILVMIMTLATVTVGTFTFYVLTRRSGKNQQEKAAAWIGRWDRLALWCVFLVLACALVIAAGLWSGAVLAAWSSLTALGSEYLVGREIARIVVNRSQVRGHSL